MRMYKSIVGVLQNHNIIHQFWKICSSKISTISLGRRMKCHDFCICRQTDGSLHSINNHIRTGIIRIITAYIHLLICLKGEFVGLTPTLWYCFVWNSMIERWTLERRVFIVRRLGWWNICIFSIVRVYLWILAISTVHEINDVWNLCWA